MRRLVLPLLSVAPLLVATGGDAGPGRVVDPDYGMTTSSVLEVDRFSDAAGTLHRRRDDPTLPAPNAPIDLDAAPFARRIVGPGGAPAICYDLDLRPAKPHRYYVFYDTDGNYQLGQFPVVDSAPGDPGYTDLWDVWKVYVPAGFLPYNSIRDMATVEKLLADPASGYRAERTGVLINAPIVPDASKASMKADNRAGSATLLYAWYRGRRAPYLYFEGKILARGEGAPVSEARVEGDVLRAKTFPGDPGYSPLRRLVGPDGKPLGEMPLNCPVVGHR